MADNLDIWNVQLLWGCCVHGINLDGCNQNEVDTLFLAVNSISKDFQNFDTNKTCVLCGVPGHLFNGCPKLTDTKIIKTQNPLWLALNCLPKAMNGLRTNYVNTLGPGGINALESLAGIHQVDISTNCTPSNDTTTDDVLSSLNDLNGKFKILVSNISAVCTSNISQHHHNNNDEDDTHTENTNNSSLNAISG